MSITYSSANPQIEQSETWYDASDVPPAPALTTQSNGATTTTPKPTHDKNTVPFASELAGVGSLSNRWADQSSLNMVDGWGHEELLVSTTQSDGGTTTIPKPTYDKDAVQLLSELVGASDGNRDHTLNQPKETPMVGATANALQPHHDGSGPSGRNGDETELGRQQENTVPAHNGQDKRPRAGAQYYTQLGLDAAKMAAPTHPVTSMARNIGGDATANPLQPHHDGSGPSGRTGNETELVLAATEVNMVARALHGGSNDDGQDNNTVGPYYGNAQRSEGVPIGTLEKENDSALFPILAKEDDSNLKDGMVPYDERGRLVLAPLPQSPIDHAKAANWPVPQPLDPAEVDQAKKIIDLNRKSEALSANLEQLKARSTGPRQGAKTGAGYGFIGGGVVAGLGGAAVGAVLGAGGGAAVGALGWLINKFRQLVNRAELRANKSQLDKANKALGKLMNGKVEERLGFLTRLQDGAKQLGPSVRDAFLTTLGASGSDLARWAGQRLKEAEVKKAAEAKKAATSQLAIEPSALPAPPVEASSVAGDRDSREYSFTGLHNPGYV